MSDQFVILARELDWLQAVLETRLALHFEQDCAFASVSEMAPPDLEHADTPYAYEVRWVSAREVDRR